MKNLFLLFYFFLFATSSLSAQDYILKRDGQEIYGKVKEITSSKVIYVDTNRTDTTRHFLNKADVFIIKYKNGVKEVYAQEETKPAKTVIIYKKADTEYEGPITDLGRGNYEINGKVYRYKEIKRIMMSLKDDEITHLLNMAKVNGVFGNVIAYSSISFGFFGFVCGAAGADGGETALEVSGIVLGILCLASNATNIILKINKQKKIKEAIALYNLIIEQRTQNK